MRIGLVVTGGVDESARDRVTPTLLWLIERLARRHDVTVYVLRYHDQPRSYALLGATVRDLGRPAGLKRQYAALIQAVRRNGPLDVIHGYLALPAGLAAATVARRLRIPSIVTMDSGEFVALPAITYGLRLRWRQRLAVSLTARLATRLTVCSHYQEHLAQQHGARPDVIPLGVDLETFTRGAANSEGPPWRLLHVASLNHVKDQPTLIEAFRLLTMRVPDVHLDIAGEDTLNGAIEALVHAHALDARVTFRGSLPTKAVAGLYHRSHLLVMSSLHEGAGAVVLEAAACGVPTDRHARGVCRRLGAWDGGCGSAWRSCRPGGRDRTGAAHLSEGMD